MDEGWIEPFEDHDGGVSVQNLTGRDLPGIESLLEGVPAFVLAAEGPMVPGEISLVLTTDAHLSQLHAEHLNDGSLTDVMTFPYEAKPGQVSGDIVISVDRAVEQAVDVGWPLDQEILFIAIHGMLHLCGWDDHSEEERAAMHRRQHEILTSINTAGSDRSAGISGEESSR